MLLIIVTGLVVTLITFAAVYIVLYKKQQTMFEERDAMLKEYSENIERNRYLHDDQYSKTKKNQHVLHKNAHQMYDRNIQDVQNLGIIANADLIDLNDHTSNHYDSLVKLDRVSKKRDKIFKQKYASINDTIVNADNIKRGLDLSIHKINANIERVNYNHNIIETNMQTINNQLSSNNATMKQLNDALVELDSTITSLYNSLKTQKDRLNELEDVLFEFKSQGQVEPSQVEALDMKLEETRKANMALQTQLKNIESVITSTLTGTQIADLSTKLIDVSKNVTKISTELERTAKKLCIGDTCISDETIKQLMISQTAAADKARQESDVAAERVRQAAVAEQQRQEMIAQESIAAAERAIQAAVAEQQIQSATSSTNRMGSDGDVGDYKGCWNDFAYKGLPRPLEDTVGRLDGTDVEVRQKCAKHARSSGRNIFAIQDGNACMIGNTSTHNYTRDGVSSSCNGMKGGPWLNSVWVLPAKSYSDATVKMISSATTQVSPTDVRESDGKVWAYKGCWNDFAYKGLPRPLEDTVGRLDGTDTEIRQKCAKHARSSGRNIFAIQDGNACMIGNTSRHNYTRDGVSSTCSGMKGGPWLNSVWVLE